MVAAITVLFFAVFAWLSLARHFAFQSHAFDLGNMNQAVWNTLHGHPFRFTDMAVGKTVLTSRLAIHVEPILLLLAVPYALHQRPETLLVIQAFVVASGAFPAYLLARRLLGAPWAALAFPLAFLLAPSLQGALLDDFHPVTLSASLLMFAIYFAWTHRVGLFTVSAVAAASSKEEVGLAVALLGLVLLARGKRAAGLLTLLGGVTWFLVCIAWIIPSFNPSGHSPYLSRYAYLGSGLTGVLTGALRHPDRIVGVLTSIERLTYLRFELAPFAFLPLVGIPFLVPVVPALLINMLSSDAHMYSGYYQYSAEVVPFLVSSAALGVSFLRTITARLQSGEGSRWTVRVLTLLLAVTSLLATRWYGFSPLSPGFVVASVGARQDLEAQGLARIPSTAVIAAADEIEPHVSSRFTLYLLPTLQPHGLPPAEYVVLDASIPSLPVTPGALLQVTAYALRHGYGVRTARNGFLLLRRGEKKRRLAPEFYSFAFPTQFPRGQTAITWAHLELMSWVVHPRSRTVNSARPAISLETYWRKSGPLGPGNRLVFWMSPVYRGAPPPFSGSWRPSADSPTLAWLPLPRWPLHRAIKVESLPFLPPLYQSGKVDVGVTVSGLHSPKSSSNAVVTGRRGFVRLATVSVGY